VRQGESVKLSDGEKLTILMLADIYKALKITGDFDPDFISHTIHYDHLWGFNWEYSGIPFAAYETPSEVTETGNILDMWYLVETSYKALSPSDKKKIEVEAEPFGSDVKFNGFDGNNEPHCNIARYLVDKLDRFTYFEGREFNSHFPSVPGYLRMYEIFEPFRSGLHSRGLNAAEMIQILKARTHPDHLK
jgi:uncharacterized protein YfbU (UPF0304 family)